MKPYKWQEEIIKHEGDIAIVGSRQGGKSKGVAWRISHLADKYEKTISLVIAASERQETYLFEKVAEVLEADKKLASCRQTLSKLTLKNGSTIIKIPVGHSGFYAKGATIDFLYPDEAAYIGELVWDSLIPMLAVARSKRMGWMTLLCTAFGQRGYFYKCFKNPKFKKVLVTPDMCPHLSKEFLAEELERMGQWRFNQEYMGVFQDATTQYFPSDLIVERMNFKFWDKTITPNRRFYLGIDIAGMGRDEEAFVCGEMIGNRVRNIHNEVIPKSRMNDTLRMVDKLDQKLWFKRIFMDSSGIGIGYEDLMKEKYGKRRLIGLNNASRSKEFKKQILKVDLYSNTLRLMSEGKLDLIMDKRMAKSLQSVQIIDGKIEGKNDHLAEALNRMCWCVKEKGLNLVTI